jgi:hypothetical protein
MIAKLQADVMDYINNFHYSENPAVYIAASLFVINTWLPKEQRILQYFEIRGRPGTGKTILGSTMQGICKDTICVDSDFSSTFSPNALRALEKKGVPMILTTIGKPQNKERSLSIEMDEFNFDVLRSSILLRAPTKPERDFIIEKLKGLSE